jgi:L-rhamnose mutarotase
MQRIAFVMRVRPGQEDEYRRRHQAVWPEMLRAHELLPEVFHLD